jgi:hypothetical protein
MMNDDFDTTMLRALEDVSQATRPAPDLADRLIVNAREGRPAVVRLATRRHAQRWTMPLLAAASIVALVIAGAVSANLLADKHHSRPQHSNTLPPKPTPTPTPTPTQVKPSAVPHFRAAWVSFTDDQHGWAIGDAQCPSGPKTDCPTLLATTDGGGSWHALNVPPGLVSSLDMTNGSCNTNGGITGPCVNQVLFADQSNGYLWGLHEFYWTTDGGRSWTRETQPASGEPGNNRMVIAGDRAVRLAPNQQCSSGCPGVIETAAVGSGDWTVTTPVKNKIGYYSSGLAVAGNDIYLFAGETGTNTSLGVYRSTDGGRSWKSTARDVCGRAPSLDNDAFYGAESLIADDGALIVSCLTKGVAVAPPNGSAFSKPRLLPNPLTDSSSVSVVAAESENVLTAVDESQVLREVQHNPAFYDNLTFYRTSDGGRSWRTVSAISASAWGFGSGTFGWAVTRDRDAYLVTRDGGQTWQQESFSA